MNSLKLENRKVTSGHGARRERKNGIVPGVLYGKDIKNLLFEVGELELCREISSSGQHGMLNFNMDGKDSSALLKEVQRDPVTHKIIHIDLEECGENEIIQSEVPINFIGEEWLSKKGAVLQKEKDLVRVSCKANELPKSIKVDVSKGSMGSVYRYSDLEIGNEISIVNDMEGVVASISNEKKLTSDLGTEEIIEKEEIK
ncbi:50S ribosomal protein L25 [Clostridium paraputrificum]|uniref:50S ribosomal protein L25 n=1 Tax=Clostridium TaxID=1485 RepID=UPI003D34D29B